MMETGKKRRDLQVWQPDLGARRDHGADQDIQGVTVLVFSRPSQHRFTEGRSCLTFTSVNTSILIFSQISLCDKRHHFVEEGKAADVSIWTSVKLFLTALCWTNWLGWLHCSMGNKLSGVQAERVTSLKYLPLMPKQQITQKLLSNSHSVSSDRIQRDEINWTAGCKTEEIKI